MESIRILDKRKRHPFTMIDNRAIETTALDAYEKLTYIMLCKFADYQLQTCFPSLNTLMALVGCQKPKLLKSLKRLQELRYIDVEHRRKGQENISNLYILLDLDGVVIDDYHPCNFKLLPGNLGLPEQDSINDFFNISNDQLDNMISLYSQKYSLAYFDVMYVYNRCKEQYQIDGASQSFTDCFSNALKEYIGK